MITPRRVDVAERVVLIAGALLLIIGIGLYEWRAAVVLLGVLLIASVVEVPRR